MNLTKSITISLACVAIAGSAMAQTFKEWQDPNINEVNRLAMHADYFAYEGIEQAKKGVQELSSNYLSLNNLTLGYTFPSKWTAKLGLSSLRIYGQAENVALWSKRKGLDPRQGFLSSENYTYSPIRTLSGGIRVSF